MKKYLLLSLFIPFAYSSCTTNSITGRSQVNLFSEQQLEQEANSQYAQFKQQNGVLPSSDSRVKQVRNVGNKLVSAIKKYYASKGASSEIANYQWEFNVTNDNSINAWCMPGGKVMVYTGIFPVTKNDAALAIVMGHEITHAIAQHSNERMSQVALAQGLGQGVGALTGNSAAGAVFRNVYAPAATVGVLLPNSRKQELEADRYGMIFAAMAGYNPNEAVAFWQRMASASEGAGKPPTFLSTHPSDADRIAQIKKYLPEAMKYYKK